MTIYFVHYDTLVARGKPPQRLVLGPYTIDEAIVKRQEMARLEYVSSAFIDLRGNASTEGSTP